jgi:hypothetical protein
MFLTACVLLTNLANREVFSQQQAQMQTSPFLPHASIMPIQQEQQEQALPPFFFPQPAEQQPSALQPTASSQGIEGFYSGGNMDSLIFAPGVRWIATGEWNMTADNGSIKYFRVDMKWFAANGTKPPHTHELKNFRPTGNVKVNPDNSVIMSGLVDVGTNGKIVWPNVKSNINVQGGKTIAISLDNKQTNNHFAGQTIYGLVKSFARCSEMPGANMEVLPPCPTPPDSSQ